MTAEKMFPVLMQFSERVLLALGCPRYVPWSLLEPHENQALRNHSQTLKRLAERGGLGPDEMVRIIEGLRWDGGKMTSEESVRRLLGHIATHKAIL